MYADFFFDPLAGWLWLFLALFLLYFLQLVGQLKRWVLVVPVVLILLLLRPGIKMTGRAEAAPEKIYVDTSLSALLVDNDLRLKAIDKISSAFGISASEIYDFRGRKISPEALKDFKSLVHGHYLFAPRGDGFVLSDLTVPAAANQLRLPLKKKPEGIYNIVVPQVCYITDRCPITFDVQSERPLTISLKVSGKVVEARSVSGRKQVRLRPLLNTFGVGNRVATLEFNGGGDLPERFDLLLALQKGLPSGTFKNDRTSLLSWRLSVLLNDFPFWKVQLGKGGSDFTIHLIERFTNVGYNKPALLIWPNGSFSPSQGWQKKGENLFTRGRVILYTWPIPGSRGNVFLDSNSLRQALNEFARKLTSKSALLQGSNLSVARPVYVNELEIDQVPPLRAGERTLVLNKDAASERNFFLLPFWQEYQFQKLNFRSNVQEEELATIFSTRPAEKDFSLAVAMAEVEKEKQAEVQKTSIFLLGLSSDLNQVFFLLLLALCLLSFWYLPVYRDQLR